MPVTAQRLKTSAMIASIAAEGQRTASAPFGHALAKLAATRPEIVGLTADLGKYTDLNVFAAAYPDRFYQMGMAEQLLMGAAAGMAREGFVPFATTYAVFAARRAYDFIYMAIAEERLNVKIVCALPGLTTGYGPSHQATEDIAIFRGVPNLTIIDPCDALEIEQATAAIADHQGPVYMRLLRGKVPLVLDEYDYRFEIGKAVLLRDGSDVLFVSSGLMTVRALAAADALRCDGIDVGVLHVSTIKPLDEDAIAAALGRAGRLAVILENHTVIGGLGEAAMALSVPTAAQCEAGAYWVAGRVSRRRRAADPARSIRYFDRADRRPDSGMAMTRPSSPAFRALSKQQLAEMARINRRDVTEMFMAAGNGHFGSCFSCTEVITALYFGLLRVDPQRPDWADRDRFVMSKGHAAPTLYSALIRRGFFPASWIAEYETQVGTRLMTHPSRRYQPGVDASQGALGHGLPIGVGMALAGKIDRKDYCTYVLMGDGETNEGSVWEAAAAAAKFGLGHLTGIVDCNRLSVDGLLADVMPVEPLADRWRAFGWEVTRVDGHDLAHLCDALAPRREEDQGVPRMVIADTIKGRGVSFMENVCSWHADAIDREHYEMVLAELERPLA